ncbi:MAG: SDR family NAD(P)-dependent oxidoreductase, partial [Acidimicrobiales bacterium]
IEDWERIIGVNLTGTFLMSQAALPHLMETHGNIVNTASNAGLMGQKYSAAYCASKGGVVMLTKALSNEYIDKGVRVNCVAPGGVETPIMDSFTKLPEGADTKFFRKIMSPLGMAKPSELASLFAYIASDEARYMTGSIVSMDGGLVS